MQGSIHDISITDLPPIFKEDREGVRYFSAKIMTNKLRPTYPDSERAVLL